MTEKDKFQMYWEQQKGSKAAGKQYNPRFQYEDAQGAQRVVDNMRVVFSNRFKAQAKVVIDQVIKLFGNAQNYKE